MSEGNGAHDGPQMTALAYYMQAVQEREREHMPLIGPSVDRRSLSLVTRLANSDTIRSLMCFTCAQIFTSVKSWEEMSLACYEIPLASKVVSVSDFELADPRIRC